LQLTKDKEIVQAWRADDWPSGHYSIAIFRLTPVRGGTRLAFQHIGVPDRDFRGINEGWVTYYWKPLKSWFERK
jgi:activator of HSP90 ATPase